MQNCKLPSFFGHKDHRTGPGTGGRLDYASTLRLVHQLLYLVTVQQLEYDHGAPLEYDGEVVAQVSGHRCR